MPKAKRRKTSPSDEQVGKVPGVDYPAPTREQRVRMGAPSFKSGKDAQLVTEEDTYRLRLARINKDAPGIVETYSKMITEGDITARQNLVVEAFTGLELGFREAMVALLEQGPTITEEAMNPETGETYDRTKAHPLIESVNKLANTLGYTAEHQQLTPKSQDEGSRDRAQVEFLRRQRLLQEGGSEDLPPPPE